MTDGIKCNGKWRWERRVPLQTMYILDPGVRVCTDGKIWGPAHHFIAAQLGEESPEFGVHTVYLVTYRRSAWATSASV